MKLAKITVLLTLFFSNYLYPLAVDFVHRNNLNFNIISVNNKTLSDKDFLGKMTLINFGTLDSEASLKEKIFLQEFINSNRDLNINYIPIMLGEKQQVDSFVKNNKFSYDFYRDPKNILTKKLKVTIVPSSFILNENGFIVYKHIGILDFSKLHSVLEVLNKNSKEVFSGK
ncbi:MAG: TlpA family protein disulfide reductase [Fusobacteriaceae bacterium]